MTSRPPRLRLAALFAVLILLAAGGLAIALAGQTSLETYRSPYVFSNLKAGAATQRLAERVVVVVVDGLRLDTSLQLPELNALRAQGAAFISRAGQPSYSLPTYATLGTGAWPEIHGFLMNSTPARSPVDSVFAEAKRAGLVTGLSGYSWWDNLFGDDIDYKWTNPGSADPEKDTFGNLNNPGPVDREVTVADEAIRILRDKQPDLLYVHFQDTDQKAHDFGAGRRYLDEARVIGTQVGRLAAEVDLARTAVVVTADHGEIIRGGHGGWEQEVLETPLILAGQGIRHGEYSAVEQVDIPVTVAALLGIPFPTSAQGHVLWEALDVSREAKAAKEVALAQTQAQFAAGYMKVVGGPPPSTAPVDEAAQLLANGDAEHAYDRAMVARAVLATSMSAARNARLSRERWPRLPVLLLVPAIPLLIWKRVRRAMRVGLAAAAAFLLAFHGLFLAEGNSYSLSTIHSAGSFIQSTLGNVALAALAGAVVAGILLRRVPRPEQAFHAIVATGGVIWIVLVQVAACFFQWGALVTWTVPDMLVSFWLFLCLFQLAGIALLSPIVAGLAVWVARLGTGQAARLIQSSPPGPLS